LVVFQFVEVKLKGFVDLVVEVMEPEISGFLGDGE
jgi:hypothetical protein